MRCSSDRQFMFRNVKLVAGVALCCVAVGLLVQTVLAQTELPDFVKDAAQGTQSGGQFQQLMVTIAEFKKFKPQLQMKPSEAAYPALMTAREAYDYALFAGKRIDVDLLWQAAPSTMPGQEKPSGKGYLVLGGAGAEAGATPLPWRPAAPPGMVYVPEGIFTLGSDAGDPDEAPKQQAAAGPFYIDKYEVSNAEYKAVVPSFTVAAGAEDFPVVVTWQEAAAYAEKVGKRLPTEAEWEKAARGTDGRTFPWGDSYDHTFVVWDEKVPRGGAPARPESPYGCVDMAGGVWEWTADWYKPYPGSDSPSDQYGETYKVIRGGASFNDIAMCRTTHRYYLPPNTTGHLRVGFRCVKDLEPAS